MDRHVRRLLNRVAIALAAVATAALLHLFAPRPPPASAARSPFLPLAVDGALARTSCDAASRRVVDPDIRLASSGPPRAGSGTTRPSPRPSSIRSAGCASSVGPPEFSASPPERANGRRAPRGRRGDVTGVDR
ncbi:hypothetical protein ZWY2020_050846 [Hordeum vulgare]|nr:hypothetical protein ZWY2020_050846 [Hordeum vulgare]